MNIKKIAAIVTAVGMLGAAGAAYAVTAQTPAEIAAGLTGKTVADVTKERYNGKNYGTIVMEAGKLEEFKTQMLEQKKEVLDQRVKSGTLTQAQADEIYNTMKNNQANCDGSGSAAIGRKYNAGLGRGNGAGSGQGAGRGAGMHNGSGMGAGRCVNR